MISVDLPDVDAKTSPQRLGVFADEIIRKFRIDTKTKQPVKRRDDDPTQQ